MKRLIAIILLVTLLLCGCAIIDESTVVTRTGTVTDHAMAEYYSRHNSYQYLSVEFEDGTGVCAWNIKGIPHDVQCGDTVEITIGRETGFDQEWVLLEIKKVS